MRFVLYNHIGSANHGCEALVRTISLLLGRERTILLSEHLEEENQYGINKLINVYPAITGKQSAFDLCFAYIMLKVKKNYFHMDVSAYKDGLKKVLKKDDVLVSIGGDIFCYENYPKYNLLHQFALTCVNNSILLGCSIEPEVLNDKNLVRDLKSFKLITARESITYNALKNIGLANVEYCPDTAFVLEKMETEVPKEFKVKNTVGINLSPLILKKADNKELLFNNFQNLIKYILEKSDSSIALIPHVVWKENDDRIPLKMLYDEFADSGRICLIENQNACQLKWIISNCSYFIGARTHAAIAAYSSMVPTLVLGYSVKSQGIARDLFGDEDNYVLSYKKIKSGEDLLNKFIWITENKQTIVKRLYEKNAKIKNRIDEFQVALKERFG